MAYTDTPADLFAGMSEDGTNMIIPIAALSAHGLTAALADATTGDARALAYAFAARIEEWYREIAEADRPQALTAETKASVVLNSATIFPGDLKEEIKVTAYKTRPDDVIAAEPA